MRNNNNGGRRTREEDRVLRNEPVGANLYRKRRSKKTLKAKKTV